MTEKARALYALDDYEFHLIPGHEGGRNQIVIISRNGDKQYVLRISGLGDRCEVKVSDTYSYWAEIRSITKSEDDGTAPIL